MTATRMSATEDDEMEREDEGLEPELAHVLFMDIVGYSRLPAAMQVTILRELQELVQGQPEVRRAGARKTLLCLPTGDGMALVFFREPLAPLECAAEIAKALRSHPRLKLRMGIHSGPVYRVDDVNKKENVAGGGINLAQRVMDCGDAGHILVSRATAELIEQMREWPLEYLGECEVKHGTLHLYNVYTREFGNPERPSRARPPGPLAGWQVVLLYRGGNAPEVDFLKAVMAGLQAQGAEVFWDQQLQSGMQWAAEMERRIREAKVVIPLLSTASVRSEMLAEELQIARDARDLGGSPRIVPVRLEAGLRLPLALAAAVEPLPSVTPVEGEEPSLLVAELVSRCLSPQDPDAEADRSPKSQPAPPEPPPCDLEPIGGAVPLDSPFYVARSSDTGFLTAIARRDSVVLVKGARQMGKTSLLARGMQQGRRQGLRVALFDLQWLNGEQLASADRFFIAAGEALADQLDLDTYPDEFVTGRSGASVSFQRFMRRVVLGRGEPLVWGLDEVDRLFSYPYAPEVFGLFRSWHNARALDPTGPWSRLTLAIAYATEAHLFITDVNQSPFNVGTRVTLHDFTAPEVADLNARYGKPLRSPEQMNDFRALLNGHPYLTRRGLHALVTEDASYGEFSERALESDGPFGDHLRRILMLLARDERLGTAMRNVVRGGIVPDTDAFYRLRSAGLITGESPHLARVRCRLYGSFLERHL